MQHFGSARRLSFSKSSRGLVAYSVTAAAAGECLLGQSWRNTNAKETHHKRIKSPYFNLFSDHLNWFDSCSVAESSRSRICEEYCIQNRVLKNAFFIKQCPNALYNKKGQQVSIEIKRKKRAFAKEKFLKSFLKLSTEVLRFSFAWWCCRCRRRLSVAHLICFFAIPYMPLLT